MADANIATRRRTNISIAPNIHRMGDELAKQDHRDFSNELEWLIEQEYRRRKGTSPNGNGAAKAAEATADINAGLVFKLPGRDTEYTMTRGPHPKDFPEGADRNKIMEACQLWEAWRMDIEMSRAGDEVEAEREEE